RFLANNSTNRFVAFDFSAVSAVAKVTTSNLLNPSALGPLTGTPLIAAQLSLGPVLGSQPVTFQTALTFALGDYTGNGSDLLVYKWTGASWSTQAFAFVATNHSVVVPNVTSLSAFAVTQSIPPQLSIQKNGGGYLLQFTPLI